MDRLAPTLIMAGILALLFFLMWRGWKARQMSQAAVPAPHVPHAETTSAPYAGQYVATTYAHDHLERINVHGLGVRTGARVFVEPSSVVFALDGVGEFEIPAADLRGVSTSSGMIGKFVERDGLVIIDWTLGNTEVSSGFRPRIAAQKSELIDKIDALTQKVT